ncbi:MAG: TfoX/Sxy family protein [Planctomycetaceae bacterium]
MPFSSLLAARITEIIRRRRGFCEKRMFGGIVWMLHDHLCFGVWKDSLIARIGAEIQPAALRQPGVSEFDITGRPMRAWVMVGPEAIEDDELLQAWLERCIEFVRRLPPKGE